MAVDVPAPVSVPPASPGLHGWRRWTVWTLIVVATILLLVSSLSVWARRQVLNTDHFVSATSRLLDDPQIRQALSVYMVNELYNNVDVAGQLKAALPGKSKSLAGPLAGGLRQVAPRVAYDVLGTAAVQSAFRVAMTTAHTTLLRIIDGKPGAKGEAVYLKLRPIIVTVATRVGLQDQVAAKLPPDAGQLQLFKGDQIDALRKGVKVFKALSVFLALVVLGLYVAALVLARGWRRSALMRIGIGVLLVGIILLALRSFVGTAVIDSLTNPNKPLQRPAANASWLILTELLVYVGWTAVVFGIIAILFAFFSGPSRPARAVRRWIAPGLVRHPWVAWSIVALLILVSFLTVPIEDVNKLITRCVLIVLLVGGTEMLRRTTLAEYPDGGWRADDVQLRKQPQTAGTAAVDPTAQLERLVDLRDKGAITEEEFQAQKSRILAG